MKIYITGTPDSPLRSSVGELWVDIKNSIANIGGYTQTQAWFARSELNRDAVIYAMPIPDFVDLVLRAPQVQEEMKRNLEDAQKRLNEAQRLLRETVEKAQVAEAKVVELRRRWTQSRKTYRRIIRKVQSLGQSLGH